MTVLNANQLNFISKNSGVDPRTTAEFLLRLERLGLNSEVAEDGSNPIVSLQDASVEGI